MDECALHTRPYLAKVWRRCGRPRRVLTGPQRRRTVFGALDYGSGDLIRHMCPAKGGDAVAAFLQQLAETWPDDQLVLVLDNVSYHRSPVVRRWWAAQHGYITAFWLPVSSPHLNLIERVWRFLKQKLPCHRFWNDGRARSGSGHRA